MTEHQQPSILALIEQGGRRSDVVDTLNEKYGSVIANLYAMKIHDRYLSYTEIAGIILGEQGATRPSARHIAQVLTRFYPDLYEAHFAARKRHFIEQNTGRIGGREIIQVSLGKEGKVLWTPDEVLCATYMAGDVRFQHDMPQNNLLHRTPNSAAICNGVNELFHPDFLEAGIEVRTPGSIRYLFHDLRRGIPRGGLVPATIAEIDLQGQFAAQVDELFS